MQKLTIWMIIGLKAVGDGHINKKITKIIFRIKVWELMNNINTNIILYNK